METQKLKTKIKYKIIFLLFVLHECSNLLLLLMDIDGVSLIAVLNTVALKGCPGGCRLSVRENCLDHSENERKLLSAR